MNDKTLHFLKSLIATLHDFINSYIIPVDTDPIPDPDPVDPDPVDPTPDPEPPTQELQVNGIAMSGLEFAENTLPGKEGTNYKSNSLEIYNRLKTKGFKDFRVSFLTKRLNSQYINYIEDNIERAGSVWLDHHDYGKDYDISKRVLLATEFKDNDRVKCIEIDNEPHGGNISKDDWYNKAKETVIEMRSAGWNKLIGIPIWHWSSMDDFFTQHGDNFVPPVLNDPKVVYIFHNYFNLGNTGFNHPTEPNEPAQLHVDRLKAVIAWAKKNNVKLAITEYGCPPKQNWIDNMKPFIQEMKANPDTIIAFFYWATGDWYNSDTKFEDIHLQAIF